MKQEIKNTTHGGAPGRPEWRSQISNMLRETYRDITESYMEVAVGLPDNLDSIAKYIFVRAMIITEGSGSAVGNAPITAGPYGRSVWNDSLTGKNPSSSMITYKLPSEFNQKGNHFIENAVKLMRKEFRDILDEATDNIPSDIVAKHTLVR